MNQLIKSKRTNSYMKIFSMYQKRISSLSTSILLFEHKGAINTVKKFVAEIHLIKNCQLYNEAKDWLTQKNLI